MSKSFFFRSLVGIFLLISLDSVLAADDCGPAPNDYTFTPWYEYSCQGSECGDDVLWRECQEVCMKDCECLEVNGEWNWSCDDWNCQIFCDAQSPFLDCQLWQTCDGSDQWTKTSLGCQCSAPCLLQPNAVFPEDNTEEVKLPVTFRWDAVEGAQTYHYEIVGVTDGVVDTPSILIDDCQLKSNKDYEWRVQACCDSNCWNPGPWSDSWSFKTSLAPELLYPPDGTGDVSVIVALDWCDVEEAESYFVQRYEEGEYVPPFLITEEGGVLPSAILEEPPFFTKDTSYEWEVATCLNPDGTKCEFDCQNDQEGSQCGTYSQRWEFTTVGFISAPELNFPKVINGEPPTVNISHYLGWKEVSSARSYRYQIKEGANEAINNSTIATAVYFVGIWDDLDLDIIYTWRVKSCWDKEGENCEEEWSEEWSFKTTGAPPAFEEDGSGPANGAVDVSIPAKLNWDDMLGAASYYYNVGLATGTVKNSEVLIGYPTLKQNLTYDWQVRTCADGNGKRCGEPAGRNFTTFTLSSPSNPDPEDGGIFLTSERYLEWKGTADIYQYKLDYQGIEKIPPTIVVGKTAYLPVNELEIGEYIWYVQSCLDKDCQETSASAGPWHFTLVESGEGEEKGIVPCGRNYDDPRTPWNERENCQIKHIFIMLKNIINFVLWRLGLILLVLLTMATAVIYYFSTGAPQTMAKVKSIWKSAGYGYAAIFVGWIIVNLLLAILGYRAEIFGDWWQIVF